MNQKIVLLSCCISLSIPVSLFAQGPVKSVDESGNVTYSDRPTSDAVSSTEVSIQPGPSQSEIDAAKQRADQMKEQADQAQAEREAATKKQAMERKATEVRKPEPESVEASGYPAYKKPARPTPPIARPPTSGSDHPDFQPSVNTPRAIPR